MPLREDSPLAPVSPYGEAKLAMERVCREAEVSTGLRIAVVRAFNLVGPGQHPFNAASSLAAADRRGGERGWQTRCVDAVAWATRGPTRDLIDVRDAARALVDALEPAASSGTFNLCSGQGPQRRRARPSSSWRR